MNDRDKLLRRSRRTRKEPDISAYKRKRNEVNIAVKRAKSDYHKKLLKEGLIKDSALISAPLAHLINLSLKTSIFPTEWKAAKVIPTHKSGVHSNPDNYRPISVLPVISKVIEKIVHRQLITYLDKNNLLTKSQFGFRPKLSTEYAATILLDGIRVKVDKGRLVGAIFVDLSFPQISFRHHKSRNVAK
eukprot:gene814-110_t